MREIIIVPYDRRWPLLFESEKALLEATLGKVIVEIHHIGSTSVSGLAAKPVIDILLEVASLSKLDNCNAELAHIGYTARGENGISERRYFTKGGDQRTHQVHAFMAGSSQIIRHLAFRDYLIKNKAVAEQYAGIKRAAALACENDIYRYSVLKAGFIEHHLQQALKS